MQALFSPLNRKRKVPIQNVVASLRHRRQEFAEQCIAAIVKSSQKDNYFNDLVEGLVQDWGLDVDGVTLKVLLIFVVFLYVSIFLPRLVNL